MTVTLLLHIYHLRQDDVAMLLAVAATLQNNKSAAFSEFWHAPATHPPHRGTDDGFATALAGF